MNQDNSNVAQGTVPVFYWIAVNGASAAISSCPLPLSVKVTPTPELLIGFKDQKAALVFQSILLNAPLPTVRKELRSLRRRRDAVFIDFPNPEPPTRGSTVWEAAASGGYSAPSDPAT